MASFEQIRELIDRLTETTGTEPMKELSKTAERLRDTRAELRELREFTRCEPIEEWTFVPTVSNPWSIDVGRQDLAKTGGITLVVLNEFGDIHIIEESECLYIYTLDDFEEREFVSSAAFKCRADALFFIAGLARQHESQPVRQPDFVFQEILNHIFSVRTNGAMKFRVIKITASKSTQIWTSIYEDVRLYKSSEMKPQLGKRLVEEYWFDDSESVIEFAKKLAAEITN